MKDGIHIASGDYVAVRKMSAEIWVIRLSTKTVTKLPISGDVFALSPDGQFVLVLSSSSLTLMKVDTKTVQKSYTLESDITVSKMGWVNSMVAWLATSEGIQLWDVDPSGQFVFLANYDDDYSYKDVCDVHLSENQDWYMIHFKDDAVGRIQLGRVNEDYWNIMEGLAGTFFVSTCRYEKGPFVSYFFRKSDDPNKYYFKTDDLANPEEEFMDPGTMDWDDELEGDFAEHMFVDPKTLVATLTTNKGNTQLWDLREGFILATNDTKIKFQACAPLNGGGYICLPENSTVITSVTFDPEKLVYVAFSRRFSERIPMLLACRYNMHDTENPLLADLVQAVYQAAIPKLVECIVGLTKKRVPEMSSDFLNEHGRLLGRSMEFIYNTWCIKRGIDWEKELSWFYNTYKNAEMPDPSPSPLLCKHRLSMEELADCEKIKQWEIKLRFVAQKRECNAGTVRIISLFIQADSTSLNEMALVLIAENQREPAKALYNEVTEWMHLENPYKDDTLDKLATSLKEQGLDENCIQAKERLLAMSEDPVNRGIMKVRLRHLLQGDVCRQYSSFIRRHVVVDSLDVTDLVLDLLGLSEEEQKTKVAESVVKLSVYARAKVRVLLKEEMKRLQTWKPYFRDVRQMMREGVKSTSEDLPSRIQKLYGKTDIDMCSIVKNMIAENE